MRSSTSRRHALLAVVVTLLLLGTGALLARSWLARPASPAPVAPQSAPTRVVPGGPTAPRSVAGDPAPAAVPAPSTRSAPAPGPPAAGRAHEPPPRLRVRVQSASGAALAAAEVRVSASREEDGQVPVAGTTDAQGLCELALPSLLEVHPFEAAGRGIVVRAWASGHRDGERRLQADQLLRTTQETVLVLEDGARLRGLVLDELGAPVSGATVTLQSRPPDRSAARRLLDRATTDASGRYVLGHGGPPEAAEVLARHAAHGSARLPAVGLAARADLDLPALTLRPAGLLEGRVRFPDGRPARGVAVQARRLARGGADDGEEDPADGVFGLPDASVESDELGRFRFADLEPGVYLLDSGNAYDSARRPLEERLERYVTGTRGIELPADYAVLRVAVVDAGGRALRAVPVDCLRLALDADGDVVPRDRTHAFTRGAPPRAVFPVLPGERLVLRADLPACHRAEVELAAPDACGESEHAVVVHARSASGRLRPLVRGAGGAPAGAWRLDVYNAITRLQERRGLAPDEAGEVELAPGRWLVAARAAEAAATSALPRGQGAAVEVRPAATTTVELLLE